MTPAGRSGLSFRGWALLVTGLHLLLGLLLYEPTLFPGGDNAGYMILGESLRSGSGYRDLYLPGAPIHTKYPPAYPALLGVLGWAGGVQLFKLASLAFTTLAVWLTAHLGRRLAGTLPGLLAAGLLAVNPVLLEYAHWVLSEAPFVALVVLSLWLLHRSRGEAAAGQGDPWATPRGGPVPRRRPDGEPGGTAGEGGGSAGRLAFALGTGAAVAAFLTRTAGLALLLAVALGAVLGRRRARAAAAGVAAAVAMAGWGVFQRLGAPGQAGYLRELLLRNPYDPAAGTAGVVELVTRGATNFWGYVSRVLPESLTALSPAEAPDGVLVAVGVVASALAVAGWLSRSAEELGYAEVFVLLYVGMISLWPEVWTDRRFLLPAVPLILVYLVRGASGGAARVLEATGRGRGEGGRTGKAGAGAGSGGWSVGAAGALVAGLLAVPAVGHALSMAPERIECLVRYRAGDPCEPPAMASFYAAARWARENTEPDAVVANRKPRLFYWVSRRRGDVYRYSSEPELVIRGLEELGADYVLVDRISATTIRYLIPAIQAYRDRFEVVYEGGGFTPPSPILRFHPVPGTALRAPPGGRARGGASRRSAAACAP